jgi:predicted nucleic acid-binding protein
MDRQRILIDTSVLIDHLRRQNKERSAYFQAAQQFDCSVSVITEFEFRVGATQANQDFVSALLDLTPILSFDSACVHAAASIYRDLRAVNRLIALPDLFIAATAVAYDLPLLTLNRTHFERVSALTVLAPSNL